MAAAQRFLACRVLPSTAWSWGASATGSGNLAGLPGELGCSAHGRLHPGLPRSLCHAWRREDLRRGTAAWCARPAQPTACGRLRRRAAAPRPGCRAGRRYSFSTSRPRTWTPTGAGRRTRGSRPPRTTWSRPPRSPTRSALMVTAGLSPKDRLRCASIGRGGALPSRTDPRSGGEHEQTGAT